MLNSFVRKSGKMQSEQSFICVPSNLYKSHSNFIGAPSFNRNYILESKSCDNMMNKKQMASENNIHRRTASCHKKLQLKNKKTQRRRRLHAEPSPCSDTMITRKEGSMEEDENEKKELHKAFLIFFNLLRDTNEILSFVACISLN